MDLRTRPGLAVLRCLHLGLVSFVRVRVRNGFIWLEFPIAPVLKHGLRSAGNRRVYGWQTCRRSESDRHQPLTGCSVTGLVRTRADIKKPVANDPKDGELSVVRMKGV